MVCACNDRPQEEQEADNGEEDGEGGASSSSMMPGKGLGKGKGKGRFGKGHYPFGINPVQGPWWLPRKAPICFPASKTYTYIYIYSGSIANKTILLIFLHFVFLSEFPLCTH